MDADMLERALLDRIFETSPTGIVVLTPTGTITRCNERATALLDLEESAIEGRTYAEPEWTFVDESGEPIDDEDHPFVQVRQSRGPIFSQEYRMIRPHAEPIDLSISGAPITDETGSIEHLVFSFEDITQLRARERDLETMTRKLEVLNRVVRHDIRNDMAVVTGWLETLEDELETRTGREAMERVQRTAGHVVELTEAARDLVNVVTEEERVDLEPVDLAATVENEVAIARDTFPDAAIAIRGEIPSVTVSATDLLGSVFRNLLSNAVRHNDTDQPTVRVAAERDGASVRVTVEDDGPGVPEAQKWRIFGKGETGLESGSTGIGLYLVDTLVRQFGGDVWVTDNDPRGAVFVVELPILD